LRRLAAQELKIGICDGCFSGVYPVPVNSEEELPQLSLFRAVEDEPDLE
jgi:hypothetical protein